MIILLLLNIKEEMPEVEIRVVPPGYLVENINRLRSFTWLQKIK